MAVFAGPVWPAGGAVIFAAIAHLLFRTLYAVVSIPYAGAVRPHHPRQRPARRHGRRADGVRHVGGHRGGGPDPTGGPGPVDAGGAAPGLADPGRRLRASSPPCACWRWPGPPRGLDVAEDEAPPPRPLLDVLRSLAANRALMLVLGAVVLSAFSGTMFSKNLLYYFKYVVGDAKLGSAALAIGALTAAICVPAFAVVVRLAGKRATWLIGAVPGVAGLVLWHPGRRSGRRPAVRRRGAAGRGPGVLRRAVSGACCPTPSSMANGARACAPRSLVFGLVVLGQKAALGLGAGFLGIALTHVGYVPNAAQSPETLAGIKAMMFWIPLAGGLVSAGLIALYPITRASHEQMVAEIAARSVDAPVAPPSCRCKKR
ncbi:MFS transporter [Caulobacter segnis]